MTKIILSSNTDWYLYNFRLSLGQEILEHGYDLLLLSPPGSYSKIFQNNGMRWQAIRLSRRGLNPISDFSTLMQYLMIYRRERPDLVHHFTFKPVIYGSIAARYAGIPSTVNSVTGLGYLFVNPGRLAPMLRPVVRPLLRLALKSSNGMTIFQNEKNAHLFEEQGLVQSGQYLIIEGSGVDVERFSPTPEPAGDPIVLFAARMLWDKGVGELVEAARILSRRGVQGKVVLVGDVDHGNPATIEEVQLRDWESEGVIEWWGHQDDMPEILGRCQVAVLPSYGEGVSRTLIEAAAAGRPIVASDVPGCREVVRHGQNGFLVRPKDPRALADAIGQLLSDRDLRIRMGQAGRDIALERFSDKLVNAKTLQTYSSLLGSDRVPAGT